MAFAVPMRPAYTGKGHNREWYCGSVAGTLAVSPGMLTVVAGALTVVAAMLIVALVTMRG